MAEVERRLRTLETSVRVPGLSLPGETRGIQADSYAGGSIINDVTTSFSNALQLSVRTGPTGKVLVLYGVAFMVGGYDDFNWAKMKIVASPGLNGAEVESPPITVLRGNATYEHSARAVVLDLDPNASQTLTGWVTQYIVDEPGYGEAANLWMIAIPL